MRPNVQIIYGEYIYFPMPSQPEASTLPLALEFRDINLVSRIIRMVIPNDITIIVKKTYQFLKQKILTFLLLIFVRLIFMINY